MKFRLRCLKCGTIYPGTTYACRCKNGCDALLRTEYRLKTLRPEHRRPGIWRYSHWLPIQTVHPVLQQHVSMFRLYQSTKLASHLGLSNLHLCMNVAPHMKTGSFKDLEAQVSFQRVLDTKECGKPFVLSSDGNNAISYIHYSSLLHYPIYLFATEGARLQRIWSFTKNAPYCHLYPIRGDYFDAIYLAGKFAATDGVLNEGGAFNVGRRDAVGTILLEATQQLGRLPDHYFQALGSGPGAVAIYETALRLIADGRFGTKPPRLHGAQNAPFTPMVDAWEAHAKTIDPRFQGETAKALIDRTYAHVLTNRFPVYGTVGGIYDAFSATDGEFYAVTNDEAKRAQALFKKLEGISIVPEAGVTIASLTKAIRRQTINKDDTILVNITGGGREEMHRPRYQVASSVHSYQA